MSRLSFIEAAGGLVCEWSEGIAHQASSFASGTPGVAVEILPAAQDAWGRFATAYGLTETRSAFCNTADDPTNCGLNELIGEYWVHVDISGISRTSGDFSSLIPEAEAFFTSLAGQLASLPPSQPAWQPPGEITALPSQCDAVMPADEVEQILGYSSTLSAEGPHGGWSQWADARVALGGTCGWSAGDGDASVGGIEWMSYGAWAADELLALSQRPSSPEALDLPGLGANDSAHSRCASDGSFCVIDLVVRGNWIQFDIHDPAPTQTIAVTPREGALAVAAAIVARLAG